MIRVQPYAAADRERWNAFLSTAKNRLFMFHRDYMEYHADRFEDHSLLFSLEDEVLALLPANRRGDALQSHGGLTFGGFLSSSGMKAATMLECFGALREYMRDNGFSRLLYKAIPHIYHDIPAEEDKYALFRNNASVVKVEPTCTIDFSRPPALSRGRKGKISRARREGVAVALSNDIGAYMDLVNEVLAAYHQTTAVHTAGEMALLHARFPENIKLFAAMLDGDMVAGTIVYEYACAVHTQYLAANDRAREIGAMDYLISEVMAHYRESKRFFDFGISTEEAGRHLNEGLMTQKERFGGRVVVHETFELLSGAHGSAEG